MAEHADKALAGPRHHPPAAERVGSANLAKRPVDNRPAAVAQRALAQALNQSPQAAAQRALSAHMSAAAVPFEPRSRPNNTGLPDGLKAGVETLSGVSMDHVKVHYNSSQPAQLNALAYAQGGDIHLAPGQERHLPHEAWHVAQQAQGRVQPTRQLKDGVAINDEAELEREADLMGERALQLKDGAPGARPDLAAFLKRGGSAPIAPSRSANAQRVVQRVTKIKMPNRRSAVDLGLLQDHEIETLISYLEGNKGAGAVEIQLDMSESSDQLLARARMRLAARQKVTGHFNVRGRAVDTSGVVFSEASDIRAMAIAQGIAAYLPENELAVRAEFPSVFIGFEKLMDQSAGHTTFWGPRQKPRGPRADTAASPNKAVVAPPSNLPLKSQITLTRPCRRGDETSTRDSVMGGFSALNYASAVKAVDSADRHTWEWLHLIGASIGGNNAYGNLVAGTYDMNTLMIPLEQTIVEYASRVELSEDNPMTVTATATVHNDPSGRPTWVADTITLQVEHGRERFWLGPIGQKIDTLTKMEFDFYHWLFQRMSGNA